MNMLKKNTIGYAYQSHSDESSTRNNPVIDTRDSRARKKGCQINIRINNILKNNPPTPIEVSIGNTLSLTKQSSPDLIIPIVYQKEQIGSITSISHAENSVINEDREALTLLAKYVAFKVKRHELSRLTKLRLGRSLTLHGVSRPVRNIELFIEMVAGVTYPVIIKGEIGTDKLTVACAIHFNAYANHLPFIEFDCSTQTNNEGFTRKIADAFFRAKNGTLYINGIDELTLSEQAKISHFLDQTWKQLLDKKIVNHSKVRVIVSSVIDLDQAVKQGLFLRSLYTELNYLNITLPPLRERPEDIPLLVNNALEQYRLNPHQYLCGQVHKLLKRYHWPKNHSEVENTISRLATRVNDDIITLEHINSYAPMLLLKNKEKLFEKSDKHKQTLLTDKNTSLAITPILLERKFGALKKLHPALRKALLYIADNYQSDISLLSMSDSACVSSSHLSYLFKFHLGQTFKQILSCLRVEKAKNILINNNHIRITDVSYDSGFGDLSHFEKMFKRHTGLSPREYRRKLNSVA